MTANLMKVHVYIDPDRSYIVSYTAWRYETLTAWGEWAPVREISLDLKIQLIPGAIDYRLLASAAFSPRPEQVLV